jgi:hypothetical protein
VIIDAGFGGLSAAGLCARQRPRSKEISMPDTHTTAPTQFVEAGDIRHAYRPVGRAHGVPPLFMLHFRGGQPGQRDVRRGTSLAVRGLAATLAAAALVAPAAAAAQPSLMAQAKAAMQRKDAVEEAYGAIPFELGTKFTIACSVRGQLVVCDEHAGPERCTNGDPWLLLSDSFKIIGGTIGRPMTFALIQTDEYCGGR